MTATKCETTYVIKKRTYVVRAEREGTKSEIEVGIAVDGVQVHYQRYDRSNAFGSGVCRVALEDYLRRNTNRDPLKRADGSLRLKAAKPRISKASN